MTDIADGFDPFKVAVARAELDAVNEIGTVRRARVARDPGEFSNVEVSRIVSHFIYVTERKLGLPENCACQSWDEHLRKLVMAAQGGKLAPGAYRCLHLIWRTLGQPSRQPVGETVADAVRSA